MFRPARILLCAILMAPFTIGCSAAGLGTGGSLFPHTFKLLDPAKAIRDANAGPLAVPRELEKEPLPLYVVEPGDVLLVQPLDLDSPVRIPADQPVLPDGTIHLGKYGLLVVAGKTIPEIEGMVQSRVKADTKDAGPIIVRIVSRQSKTFYVLGEVNSPGAFPLQGRETVLDALMAAGGITGKAATDKIILSRPSKPNDCRIVLPVCYLSIVQLGDTSTNYQLAPGDRIFVSSKGFWESLFEPLVGHKNERFPCGGVHLPCSMPPYPGGGAGCTSCVSGHVNGTPVPDPERMSELVVPPPAER